MAKGKKGKKGKRDKRLAKTVKTGDISPEAVEKGRKEFEAKKAAEANADTETEAEAEAEADAEPDADAETEPEADAEPETEPEADAEPDAEPNADAETEADAQLEAEAKAVPLPPAAAALEKFDDLLGKIEQAAVAGFLAALVLTATVNTIKKLAFGSGFEWAPEAIRYSVFFTAISGAILASQAKRMMSMDIVNRLLSPTGRAYARMVVAAFVLVICYFFLRGGLDAHESLLALNDTYDLISPKLAIWAIPVGAVLIGFHYLLHLGIDVLCLFKGITPPEPEMSVH